ncbi:MAG: DUF4258 domain-containing protein [Actinobacteria bacterium]|nr:MAG: DUF4258 domain-containing protein [Actinomycetota bacterium]
MHAVKKMFERQISHEDVIQVLLNGEAIEEYPNDTPYPSKLMLGWINKRPIHVVVAYNSDKDETIVITTYEPNKNQWDSRFSRRIK